MLSYSNISTKLAGNKYAKRGNNHIEVIFQFGRDVIVQKDVQLVY